MKRKFTAFILSGAVCLSALSGIMYHSESYVCGAEVMYATLQKLEITNLKDTITIGESVQLSPVWGNGAKSTITWSSDNESVADVDETGKVTGAGEGTAIITASPKEQITPVTITITVSKDIKKSEYRNTSELKPGDKLHKYDTLHYDNKNIGACANIVNSTGGYDIAFISEENYTLPFDAEVVGSDGTAIYLAPNINNVTYLDGRALKIGDTVDRNSHLLCYDYHINKRVLPVFLPEYYDKYIGNGIITVKDIDHEKKTITLEAEYESLEKYTQSYEALKAAQEVMFSGNQALVPVPVGVKKDGCVIEPYKINCELTGTASASCKSSSCIKSISYDENYAMGYCLITADSPGTVRLYAYGDGVLITYMNLTVDESGNFSEEYSTQKPVPTGDINASGKAEVSDVITLRKWLLNTSDIKLRDWKMGDLNDDGKLNIIDLLMLKNKVTNENITDSRSEHIEKIKDILLTEMKLKYRNTDLSDFKLVYEPEHPLKSYADDIFFSVYYKNILLHGYGNIYNADNVYAACFKQKMADLIKFDLIVDPEKYMEVDTEAECLSGEEIMRKYESTYYGLSEPQKIIYVDKYSDVPLRLAYRAESHNKLEEYIFDAVTGEQIACIPYYVV